MHVVARIGKAHGLKGEVTVQVHTESPQERFTPGAEFVTEPDRGTLVVCTVRLHQQVYLRSPTMATTTAGLRRTCSDCRSNCETGPSSGR